MIGYPESPGFQFGSETSEQAAKAVVSTAQSHREKLLEFFKSPLGKGIGLTIDEAAVFLKKEFKRDIQTGSASARMRQLELIGVIVKSKVTRQTRAKKRAVVYFLKGYEVQE